MNAFDTEKRIPDFLHGGGEMGDRIRNFDWAKTPLGSPEYWDQSLKTCVRIMLTSSQPIWIGWGKDLIKLYNDPYKEIVGGKHPEALGQPASVVWSDIWKDIEPMLKKVMEKDEGTYVEAQLLIMERYGYPEETYYTFSYSPVPGDSGGTAGMICYNTADTERIITERSLKTLKELGSLARKKNLDEVYRAATEALEKNNKDFPCVVIYKINDDKKTATAFASAGINKTHPELPQIIDLENPGVIGQNLSLAVAENKMVLSDTAARWKDLPTGFWSVIPKNFVHVPISGANKKYPLAVLSAALNPYRKFDEGYRNFVQLVADQISLEVNNVLMLEEERKRAEALAEIDRAKTVFFTNISHEFRTPLTLMLSPLEELMNRNNLNEAAQQNVETSHRNALRLLKLVNTLLDFSRIESGRQEACFSLVDIGAFTSSLAGNFRSVIEKAGLQLFIEADTINQPVYVDKQMWEKIVFNLLSNAFKYTLHGTITVKLSCEKNNVVLRVIDSGVGIPEDELPHMFERFHRVQNITGRTFEGTGIGLSLTKELVQLHNGSIDVQSKQGSGTTFTVTIPAGETHLPASVLTEKKTNRDVMQEMISDAHIKEAFSLIKKTSEDEEIKSNAESVAAYKPCILIVDDNADMRQLIQTLLEPTYHTVTATNGQEAVDKIRYRKPDLILSDVMMPVMDGLSLVKEIKNNKETSPIPVVLITARAGEESKIEGYETGADDYLVKPFSSKELLTRISVQLKIAQKKRTVESQMDELANAMPQLVWIAEPNGAISYYNRRVAEYSGVKKLDDGNWSWEGLIHPEDLQKTLWTWNEAVKDNRPYEMQNRVQMRDGSYRWHLSRAVPQSQDGKIVKWYGTATDIHEQKMAEEIIMKSEEFSRTILHNNPDCLTILNTEGRLYYMNNHGLSMMEIDDFKNFKNKFWWEFWDESERDMIKDAVKQAVHGKKLRFQSFCPTAKGTPKWWDVAVTAFNDGNSSTPGLIAVSRDITQTKQAEEKLQYLAAISQSIADAVIGTGTKDDNYVITSWNKGAETIYGWTAEEVIGKRAADILPTTLLSEKQANAWDPSIKEKGYWKGEAVQLTKSGKQIYVQVSLASITDASGKVIGAVAVNRDITDKKNIERELQIAEEKIRKSEEHFRSLTQSLPQVIWTTNKDGLVDFFNNQWFAYTGSTEEQSYGQEWLQFVHPELLEDVASGWKTSLSKGEPVRMELMLRRNDGVYEWFYVVGIPIRDANEEIIKWVGSVTNIDHRKKYEDALSLSEKRYRELSNELEQKVQERTRELLQVNAKLEKINAELKHSNEELASFNYIASHDLKEPLRKIHMFTARILEEGNDQFTVNVRNYFDRLVKAKERMQELIEALLSYSHASRTDIQYVSTDLNTVLQEVQFNLQEVIEEKNAVIESSTLPTLNVIPLQIQQLFSNLIANAIKYSRDNVQPLIKITSETVNAQQIAENLLPDKKKYCKISIADNGIGFEQQYAAKIFELFQRLHAKHEYSGTGIGLAICKKIVQNHYGFITANGVTGAGATFEIYLPLSNSENDKHKTGFIG